jgi:hypothetical protein
MFSTLFAALVLSAAAGQDTSLDASFQPAPGEAALQVQTAPATPTLQLDAMPETDIVRASAGEYAAYHSVVADLHDAPIASGADLDSAMDRLSVFYGEDRLVRAWIAYASIIAARHPEYLDEVRELADYYGPQAALSGLMYDPAYATSFSSAADAQASVVDAVEQDNSEIAEVAHRYRMAAYNLQSERWANQVSRDRRDRLARLSEIGDDPIDMPEGLRMSLATGFDGGLPASALFERTHPVPVDASLNPQLSLTVGEAMPDPDRTRIGRILSVAALQSLDNAGAADADAAINSLLADPTVERCLAWVRLDLQQCVAAGHFKYEDSFCIAEHALLDVSRCLDTANTAR